MPTRHRRSNRRRTFRAGAPTDPAITAMVSIMNASEVAAYILGSSKEDAAQAYKAASRIFHPDRNGEKASGPDMSIINNARDIRAETEVVTPEAVAASKNAKATAERRAAEEPADIRNKSALKSDILSEIADIGVLIGRNPRDQTISKRIVKVLKRAENFWSKYTPPGGQDADAVTIKSAYVAMYQRAVSLGVKIAGGKRFNSATKRTRRRYSGRHD